jgi:hypothetical protein
VLKKQKAVMWHGPHNCFFRFTNNSRYDDGVIATRVHAISVSEEAENGK